MGDTKQRVRTVFEHTMIVLPLEKILPMKQVKFDPEKSPTSRRIASSLKEIKLVEPLVVYPQEGKGGNYILLDGHVRLAALKDAGKEDALCLIATEDEAYTYNHKVSRLNPIQEHFMVMRAIESGVSEERIATTLSLDVARIRAKRDLLKDICPEAVHLLRDKSVCAGALREMRKVKPMRQIEMAELMLATHNFSSTYAKCLFIKTAQDQLVELDKAKDIKGLTPADAARIQREAETLENDFRMIEENHGRNMLQLVLACSYLRKLLSNTAVSRFLSQRHPDIMAEFKDIAESTTLENGN
jgi:ParB-like chromosome segregation protein Spo0J